MSDKELLKIVRSFRRGIVKGANAERMCAMVCLPLASVLDICGVVTEVVTVEFPHTDHVFLRLPDGRVLDPTADQFNDISVVKLPPVYLGPMPEQFTAWITEADSEECAEVSR